MSPVTVVGRSVQRSFYLVVCLIALATGIAHAQEQQPPAYIALVEGTATIEREGEVTPAVIKMPLIPGDRVRTTNGRVEIRFPDGTGIELVEDSAVELVTPTRVRLLAGSLDRLEPLQENVNAASASYLPQDLKMYGATFDQYGSWGYAPDYGNVWYPTVAADWRPYYDGYWEPVRSYGWTWIGTDAWAWPTHHYGRWGFARGSWFWVPDRTFAAAWVSWGAAPGYVSWCPLGFDNRPVFAQWPGRRDPWRGWTVVSRTHFGSRGSFAHHNAVEPHRLPPQTTFVAQSTAPIAMPRHIGNGAAASAGTAVPRRGNAERAGAFANRPAAVDATPSRAGSLPPNPTGQPVRAGTWPSPAQRLPTNEQRPTATERAKTFESPRPAVESRPWTNDQRPRSFDRRPTTNDQRPTTNDQRPMTNDQRPTTNDYRPRAGASAPAVIAPPAPPQPRPAPSFATPRATAVPPQPPAAMPRAGSAPSPASSGTQRAPQAPPPPAPSAPQAAPQRGGSSGGGHDRAGATAQPRGDNQQRGGNTAPSGGESRSSARRRG